ncbi:hypothetical protein Dred_1993 [Desulforamulus reducens MI-1]|uniref:Uncharacterized protein n=1 Tax=Desulforamulus reducens (strain ATCC BAA-1160 / DSM 100696 / MI-1) TaxID=349161 RepID=A4J608_DESRM|nr:hypothetical protein [Desulforamulus reducens]ABO50511.1 hypothetical protein Dred_1993 [Desulforamulus reducens MI-1]
MVGASKCGVCIHKENCQIRMNLSTIIQENIKLVEAEVKRQSPKEIDYMIVTDISVIPTRCEHFRCRDGEMEVNRKKERLFFFDKAMATSAI